MRAFIGYLYFSTVSNTTSHEMVGNIDNKAYFDQLFNSIFPV